VREAVGPGWTHECIGVPEHIPAPLWLGVLGRIEVQAC
jgi:hypothetical protein